MKRATIRKFGILTVLAALLFTIFALATTTEPGTTTFYKTIPADNHISNIGTVTIVCNASSSEGYNLTNITLWHNATGTWHLNETNLTGSVQNFEKSFSVAALAISDGFSFIWNCRAADNNSVRNWSFPSSNRTVIIERPPLITVSSPTDAAYYSYKTTDGIVPINVSVQSDGWTTDTKFLCCIRENATNTSVHTCRKHFLVENASSVNFTEYIPEGRSIRFSVSCEEVSKSGVTNRTTNISINVDITDPSVTLHLPADGGYDSDGDIDFNFTVTDTNLDSCMLFACNGTVWAYETWNVTAGLAAWDMSNANVTNASLTSGTAAATQLTSMAQGAYRWNIICNDSAGNFAWASSNRTVTVDVVPPAIKAVDQVASSGYCDRFIFNWTTNETTNGTVSLGTNIGAANIGVFNSTTTTFTKSHSVTVYFNKDYGSDDEIWYNITSCDQASNCDTDNKENFTAPVPLCSGWNAYAILDTDKTLGTIAGNSTADFAYLWNQTSQTWLACVAGGATNCSHALSYGDAVWLYESTSAMWFDKNNSAPSDKFYYYNLTNGTNAFGIVTDSVHTGQIYNFSQTFYNATAGTEIEGTETVGTGSFRSFAMLNASSQSYWTYEANWSTTQTNWTIPIGWVVEVVSYYNATWNGTHLIEKLA